MLAEVLVDLQTLKFIFISRVAVSKVLLCILSLQYAFKSARGRVFSNFTLSGYSLQLFIWQKRCWNGLIVEQLLSSL